MKGPTKKHHPTPSNEIQRNSAGEHWLNRSPDSGSQQHNHQLLVKIPTAPFGTVKPPRYLIGAFIYHCHWDPSIAETHSPANKGTLNKQ
jgi:hypothetical protein